MNIKFKQSPQQQAIILFLQTLGEFFLNKIWKNTKNPTINKHHVAQQEETTKKNTSPPHKQNKKELQNDKSPKNNIVNCEAGEILKNMGDEINIIKIPLNQTDICENSSNNTTPTNLTLANLQQLNDKSKDLSTFV